MTTTKKRDDELLTWVIVGAIFTGGLIFIDFAYSSVNEMAFVARLAIWISHVLLSVLWLLSLAQWRNPNFDVTRKGVVVLSIILSLIIGIHHATTVEDTQVIIDSEQNAAKP
jgi:hypothetical protein